MLIEIVQMGRLGNESVSGADKDNLDTMVPNTICPLLVFIIICNSKMIIIVVTVIIIYFE